MSIITWPVISFFYKGVRDFEILTKRLTVIVSAIVVGVGICTIVAIAQGGNSILRSGDRGGQQSQEGGNKN
jgi:hypothetical protein